MFEFTKEEMASIIAHSKNIAKELKVWGYSSIWGFVHDGGLDGVLVQLFKSSKCKISEKSKQGYVDYLCNEVYESSDCENHPFWEYIRSISEKVAKACPVENVKVIVSEMDVDDLYQLIENKEESGDDLASFLINHRNEPAVCTVIEKYLKL